MENYPKIAIEKGTIDEVITMMIRGTEMCIRDSSYTYPINVMNRTTESAIYNMKLWLWEKCL